MNKARPHVDRGSLHRSRRAERHRALDPGVQGSRGRDPERAHPRAVRGAELRRRASSRRPRRSPSRSPRRTAKTRTRSTRRAKSKCATSSCRSTRKSRNDREPEDPLRDARERRRAADAGARRQSARRRRRREEPDDARQRGGADLCGALGERRGAPHHRDEPRVRASLPGEAQPGSEPAHAVHVRGRLVPHLRESDLRSIGRSKNVTGAIGVAVKQQLGRKGDNK